MKKVLIVTAVPETVNAFLTAYISELSKHYEVHVACTLNDQHALKSLSGNVVTHNINIARQPSIFEDLKSLFQLYRFFKHQNFDSIHSFTPKAGLLSQAAAWLARCPNRLHTFTGQVWATKKGIARLGLKWLDKLTATLTTICLADSHSQKDFIVAEKVVNPTKCHVLASGSISGVNIDKFKYSANAREQLRTEYGISEDNFIFLFVGRLKYDKGIPELIAAFEKLNFSQPAKLFIIGKDEDNLLPLVSNKSDVIFAGFKTNVPDFYSFADVLVLPSHREGFGNVIIEAAACNLPAIASNIYGLSDAVSHEYSGLLHQVKNENALASCMQRLLDSPELLATYKKQARQRVEEVFAEPILVNAFLTFYKAHLKEHSPK
ncbi:glycosyltransferase family 4 protein [Thalassotalea sp. M1531]|uniref:Glycosyltransferase family 4 protein n=1 Tax=Thalassotalea algicola TaxID=2716224 RepID=A0A7Y0Q654_9GAMM|nr:glycosyltransferase family 4 protein [Thalassotalea algicola]NMP30452.1 glycosyltransferase family 4 protein [Thalassotalea algicola]